MVIRWLLAGALAAACGGKSARVEPLRCGPRRDLGADKLEVRRALCAREVGCGHFSDTATCERVTSVEPSILDEGESGCTRYHPERLPACLDALRGAGCAFSDLELAYRGACRAPFEGLLRAGEPCRSDAECASDACLDTPCGEACCPEVCAGRDAPLGAPCAYNDDCAGSAFCEEGACAPLRQEGELCLTGGADTCVRPLWCIVGVCTSPPRLGEGCNRSPFFSSCDDSRDFCDDVTLKCVRLAPVGATCDEGTKCVAQATCRDGLCEPLPELFAPCEDGRCLGELLCDAGDRCALPPADAGEPAEPTPPECAEP